MTVESREPETSCFMFGLKATEVTLSLCPRKDRSRAGSIAADAAITLALQEEGEPGRIRFATLSGSLRRLKIWPKEVHVVESDDGWINRMR